MQPAPKPPIGMAICSKLALEKAGRAVEMEEVTGIIERGIARSHSKSGRGRRVSLLRLC